MNEVGFWNFSSLEDATAYVPSIKDLTEYQIDFKEKEVVLNRVQLEANGRIANLIKDLESSTCSRLRDLMLFCFVDAACPAGQPPNEYADLIRDTVCAYPEVTFRFIEVPVGRDAGYGLVNHGLRSFSQFSVHSTPGIIRLDIEDFTRGHRDLFDPAGLRTAIRQGEWTQEKLSSIETELPKLASRSTAFILEDEREYADLVSYCAYRSGEYRVLPIILPPNLQEFGLKELLKQQRDGGVLIHAWDVPGWEHSAHDRRKFDELQKKHIERMVITGSPNAELEIVHPNDWRRRDERFIAWKEGKVPKLRGLRKPLGWIHDLQGSGLLPEWKSGKSGLLQTFNDGLPLGKPSNSRGDRLGETFSHSPLPRVQGMAQGLFIRSREALNAGEPLLAAVFAMEGMRWLRGHSATLYLDCLQALYEAETQLEVGFASSGSSSRSDAPRKRAKEADLLTAELATNHLMPRSQVSEMKERLWSALRQLYLRAGAFVPAEEALDFIHSAQTEQTEKRPLKDRLLVFRNMLPRTWVGWIGLIGCGRCLCALFFNAPVVASDGNATLVIRWWPWGTHSSLPEWVAVWSPPVVILIALVFVWSRFWPRVALRIWVWICVAVCSIGILSIGNLTLLSDPSSKEVIAAHRFRSYFECAAWTAGSALAQSMSGKFVHADPGPNGTLSFGWRGTTRKPVGKDDDPDLEAVEDTQVPRTVLWIENILAGWLTFATGLSTVYRRASRE